jgi:nucleotide-binding universal stress UspA family protein
MTSRTTTNGHGPAANIGQAFRLWVGSSADSAKPTEKGRAGEPLAYHRILVPLSLSGSALAGVSFARSLANETNAQLLLLHVIDLNIAGEERGIPKTRLLQQRRLEAEGELGRLSLALGKGTLFEVAVGAGRPSDVILETARRWRAEAIVMCTHGVRGWAKWLHRNTADSVVRSAPCAVWLISRDHCRNALNLMVVEAASAVEVS